MSTDDPIDAAIESTEAPKKVPMLQNEATMPNGDHYNLRVPQDFGPEQLETAISLLFEMRVHVEQRKAAEADQGLVVPTKPGLVALDGRKLS
jgi:hypothetical protein